MTAQKSERLLNLLIMLLMQRRYVSKDRIRAILYPDQGDDAFERMFDRDKEELRSIGVPIELGSDDPFFDDEQGYRIRSDAMLLPEITLAADEAAVVGLATKVWEHARLAEATSDAVAKLTAAGLQPDLSALEVVEPRLSADEPAFDAFWEGVRDRVPLAFGYRRGQDAEPSERHLRPWGVVRSSGRWYAVGLDTDRDEERVFRLSRVTGEVRRAGEPGSYRVPEDVDLREIVARLAPAVAPVPATVLVREGAGASLRRRAREVEHDVAGPDTGNRWDRLVLPESGAAAADELLSLGADVCVQEPVELREQLVQRLAAVVEEDR